MADKIKKVLEKTGFPAVRLVWEVKKGEAKPDTYYTFQGVTRTPALITDDETKEEAQSYLVRVITRGDFEDLVKETVKTCALRDMV